MLEKPLISDNAIMDCLRDGYGIQTAELAFLPIGNDNNSWVYRADTADGSPYFVKLKKGAVYPPSLSVPHFLRSLGIAQVVAPLPALDGKLSQSIGDFTLIAYPFVDAHDCWGTGLTEGQWVEFGGVFRRIHAAPVPPTITLERDRFIPRLDGMIQRLDALVEQGGHTGARAAFAAAWAEHRADIQRLETRVHELAALLQSEPPPLALCHTDCHFGNTLVSPQGEVYIVDWDGPLLAPKERDLSYLPVERDDHPLYEGYGRPTIDWKALAYYRYERIVADIAENGRCVFFMDDVGEVTKLDAVRGFRVLFNPTDMAGLAAAEGRMQNTTTKVQ
jgi:spectinomycin phosphotransferase